MDGLLLLVSYLWHVELVGLSYPCEPGPYQSWGHNSQVSMGWCYSSPCSHGNYARITESRLTGSDSGLTLDAKVSLWELLMLSCGHTLRFRCSSYCSLSLGRSMLLLLCGTQCWIGSSSVFVYHSFCPNNRVYKTDKNESFRVWGWCMRSYWISPPDANWSYNVSYLFCQTIKDHGSYLSEQLDAYRGSYFYRHAKAYSTTVLQYYSTTRASERSLELQVSQW